MAGAQRGPESRKKLTQRTRPAKLPGLEPSRSWRRCGVCRWAGPPLQPASLGALGPAAEGLGIRKRKNESRLLSPDLRIEIWALGKEDTAQMAPFWKTFFRVPPVGR